MKQITTLFFFIFLSFCSLFGQDTTYRTISDYEQEIFKDLLKTVKDNSTIIIYPIIENYVDVSSLDFKLLVKKYQFENVQSNQKLISTYLIQKNKSFCVLDMDSLTSFKNNGSDYFEKMYNFYLKISERYHQEGIYYLNKPLISKNGKYAIADFSYSCGFLCGHGEIVLMQKKKAGWVIKKGLLSSQK